jgi:hypothetical protein
MASTKRKKLIIYISWFFLVLVKTDSQANAYEPPKDETILEQYNFFSSIELLEKAKKRTPFDVKLLHF